MKKISFVVMLFLIVTTGYAKDVAIGADADKQFSEKTVVIVKGMVCSFCAQGIEKKFKSFKEVKAVDVDLDSKKVTLQFHPGQVLAEDLLRKTIKDAGYEVVSVSKEKK